MASDEALQGRVEQLEAKLAELLGRRCDNCRFCALANRHPTIVYCEMESHCHSIHKWVGQNAVFFVPADHYCSFWEKDEREFEDSSCSLIYGWRHTKTCPLVKASEAREASPEAGPRCKHGRVVCSECTPCTCGSKERRARSEIRWFPWHGEEQDEVDPDAGKVVVQA